jgi:chemotaxis protein MotB
VARRKQRHEEHPDERWLVTYADVLTLMYVLFMVLFSISVVNTSKFEVLKESLSDAFNSGLAAGGAGLVQSTPGTPSPVISTPASRIAPELPSVGGISIAEASPGQILETSQLEAAERAIQERLEQAGLSDRVSLSVTERGLGVRLETDGVLFDSGQAVLRPEGARLLAPIAASLRGLPNPIRVEGHTDDTPIATDRFPSNWDLSAIRASAVVRTLIGDRIPDGRLQATGFGDTRPVADNATAAGRADNRRVEIFVLRLQGAPGQPAADVGG